VNDLTSRTGSIVGRQPIIEALKAHQPIEKILVQHGTHGHAISTIVKLARQSGVPVAEASKQRFRELVGEEVTQGVLAFVSEATYVELEELLTIAAQRNEPPFLLILDEIEDPHNLGALIRTAECAGVHGVVIPKHHSATINQTVVKTSAGAVAHLAVARVTNIANTVVELKEKNIRVVGAEMSGGLSLFDTDLSGPIAIVIGSEGRGIRRLVKEKCDVLVQIPMFGKINSLNASVSGALLMYGVAKTRTNSPKI